MRRLCAALQAGLAAAVLSSCHTHYGRPKTDAEVGALAANSWERLKLEETEALIGREYAAAQDGASDRERLDRGARELGLTDASELFAILGRDCAEPGEIARFAAARGLSAPTAARYLETRFGAAACGSTAR